VVYGGLQARGLTGQFVRKGALRMGSAAGMWLYKYIGFPFASERYRGTSLIRNTPLLGPYIMTISRVLWWSKGGWLFLMIEGPCTPLRGGRGYLAHKKLGPYALVSWVPRS